MQNANRSMIVSSIQRHLQLRFFSKTDIVGHEISKQVDSRNQSLNCGQKSEIETGFEATSFGLLAKISYFLTYRSIFFFFLYSSIAFSPISLLPTHAVQYTISSLSFLSTFSQNDKFLGLKSRSAHDHDHHRPLPLPW